MGFVLRSCALLLAAATAASTADTDGAELFDKARAKVLENARRLPRYTCVETVSRAQYLPPQGSPSTCSALIARHRLDDIQGGLVMRDKLRLDVAVVDGEEMFSWAGARNFETHDVYRLVGGGASGNGDFGSFQQSVFGSAPETIRYQGLRNGLALFEYIVPFARSNYRYRSDFGNVSKRTGYRGTFLVDPSDGNLRQLVVETDEFEAGERACAIRHVLDYQRVTIGSGDFLLPAVSTMKALYQDGGESVNETHYSGCREYVGKSSIRFDDASPDAMPAAPKSGPLPLPPNTQIEISLANPIDTERAAAGDEVWGEGKFGRETGRFYGRILRLAQFVTPPRTIVALRFDTIERGGVTQSISLRPLNGKHASPFTELPPDAGVFVFPLQRNIDFLSLWETR